MSGTFLFWAWGDNAVANFWIFGKLKSIVPDLGSLADLVVVSSDEADALEVRVDLVCRDLLAKEVCEELSDGEKEALPLYSCRSLFKDKAGSRQ